MSIALMVLVGAVAALAAALIVRAHLGRRAADRPCCAACGADARAAAITGAVCACGADLTVPRAVRLVGSRRSRGILLTGLALAALVAVFLAGEIANARRGLEWSDRLPTMVLNAGLESAATWARESVIRRLDAELIDRESAPAVATALLKAYTSRQTGLIPPPSCARLAFLLPADDPAIEVMLKSSFTGKCALVDEEAILPEQRVLVRMVSGKLGDIADAFHWFESVSVDGQPVEWGFVQSTDGQAVPGTRFASNRLHVAFTLPPGLKPGEHVITVRMAMGWTDLPLRRVARSAAALTSGGPDTWGVGVRYRMAESTVPFQLMGATP